MLQKDKAGEVKGSPTYYAKELRDGLASADVVKALKLALGVQPVVWYKQFKELGGLNLLVDLLFSDKRNMPEDVVLEALRALKVIINNKSHLEEIVSSHSELLNTIILPMDSPNPLIRIAVFEVMTPMILFTEADQGYPKVLAALDFFKYKKRESRRFETLVGTLRYEKTCTLKELFFVLIAFSMSDRSLQRNNCSPHVCCSSMD